MGENRDALALLREPGLGELGSQRRLAGQNDLQQLGVVSLEIGKHAHGLEHVIIQVLRFVDDQHKAFSRQQFFKQDLVQYTVHRYEAHSIDVHAQSLQDVLDKFARVTLRLGHQDSSRAVSQIFQQLIQQSRFA